MFSLLQSKACLIIRFFRRFFSLSYCVYVTQQSLAHASCTPPPTRKEGPYWSHSFYNLLCRVVPFLILFCGFFFIFVLFFFFVLCFIFFFFFFLVGVFVFFFYFFFFFIMPVGLRTMYSLVLPSPLFPGFLGRATYLRHDPPILVAFSFFSLPLAAPKTWSLLSVPFSRLCIVSVPYSRFE